MSAHLRVTVDADRLSIAASSRAAAQAAPMLVMTGRAFGDLAHELGGTDAAVGELLAIAEANNRPIGVNFEVAADRSTTAFIAPRGWGEERLSGRVAGKHQELAEQFGEIARVGAEQQAGITREEV